MEIGSGLLSHRGRDDMDEEQKAVLAYLQGRRKRLERALTRATAKLQGLQTELEALTERINELEEAE
jgi:chromosome segregation ATPase